MSKAKKGKVFISTTDGNLIPAAVLDKFRKTKDTSGESRQMSDSWHQSNRLAERPYNPESFFNLYESNATFYATVNQIATDVAGIGWDLLLDEDKAENKAQRKVLEEFLNKPNSRQPLRKLCEALLIDFGVVGYCAIEVIRNKAGAVAKLHHLPARLIYAHIDHKRYCHKVGQKKVWYKDFYSTEERDVNKETGDWGSFGYDDRAYELIFIKRHNPRNSYYGIPHILPAVGSVLSMLGIRDYNLSFFENYGIPAYIVVLSGEWEDDAAEKVKTFIDTELKGANNQHRTITFTAPEGCEAKVTPLSVDVKDGSFQVYYQICKEDVLAAYSMPPQRLGINVTGTLGGSNIEEATKIYIQSVIEPPQTDLEDIINAILESMAPNNVYTFRFKNLDARDLTAIELRLNAAIGVGRLSPNEARAELGQAPYDGGDVYYIASSLVPIYQVIQEPEVEPEAPKPADEDEIDEDEIEDE